MLGFDHGIRIILSNCKFIDTILGDVHGITLGIDVGIELGYLYGCFDGSYDYKIEV